jgi:hypothetical protein
MCSRETQRPVKTSLQISVLSCTISEALPEATLTCAGIGWGFAKLAKMQLFKGKSCCISMLAQLQVCRDVCKLASRRVFQSDGIRWKALCRITLHESAVVTCLMWWLLFSCTFGHLLFESKSRQTCPLLSISSWRALTTLPITRRVWNRICKVSGFYRGVDDVFALLRH